MLTLRARPSRRRSRPTSLTIPGRLTAPGHHFVAPSDEIDLSGSGVGPLIRLVARCADGMRSGFYVKASGLRDLIFVNVILDGGNSRTSRCSFCTLQIMLASSTCLNPADFVRTGHYESLDDCVLGSP